MVNDTLVIIPIYNECENLAAVSVAVLQALPTCDLLLVDDNSPDGSGIIADTLAKQDARIRVIHRSQKQGLGRAYVCGFRYGLAHEYHVIMQMDADFSHAPMDLPMLRRCMDEGADLAIGSRYVDGIRVCNWPLGRLLISLAAGHYVRFVTGMPIMDPTAGFKCFRREVLERIDLDCITSNGYSFQIELNHGVWMQGADIVERPVVFVDRTLGSSKMCLDIAFEAFYLVLRLAWRNRFKRHPHQRSDRHISMQ